MKPFAIALAALALCAPIVRAQEAKPLDIARVAPRAKSAESFAPRGWKTEQIARGDLNRDGRSDAAIVLVEAKAAHVEDGVPMGRRRALVIALNQRSGWKRVGFSNQLLLGTRDGGAFYGMTDAPIELSIEKGVVIVNMEFGSREVTTTTHRLRWEPRRKAVYLIGMDVGERDRADGSFKASSTNYLTGERKTFTSTNGKNAKTVNSKVKREWRWLGAIKEDDRYAP